MFCNFLSIGINTYIHTLLPANAASWDPERSVFPSSLLVQFLSSEWETPKASEQDPPSVIYFKPTLAHITSHVHLDTAAYGLNGL